MKTVDLTVNGERVQALVEPRAHLADFLRDQQRLTGTHLGCEHGVCGACTVLVDGQPVRSCITYAVQCEGSEIRTIEGFEDDALMKELRAAFSREYALQCGFCTPGMLIAARDLVLRLPGADERRIREEMSGNLCRCTGYVGIVRAISSVVWSRQAANESPVEEKKPQAPERFTPLEAKKEEKPQAGAVSPGTRIEDQATVKHPLHVVWAAFADMPAVAACLPGAEITESAGNALKGRITVKFGPIRAAFAGSAALERDEAAKRGVIRGAGQDALSSSRARGDIAYQLSDAGGGATRIAISIDYSLQGPLAQFSRGGLVNEFVGNMVAEFGRNLERQLGNGTRPGAPAAQLDAGGVFWRWLWSRIKAIFKPGGEAR
jgi:aerobic-type carbon monoxide dehydrogenase small subunit (CoxS/CutS family)/carbon monoxide dehydrogenase subunit G